MNKFVSYVSAITKRLALLPAAKLKYGKKEVWLVCERGTDARDNGYHIFRYLRKEHPEIDAWYVISRSSPDLAKITELGNIAFRGSLNHWLLYLRATKILTAFEPYYCPSESYRFERNMRLWHKQKIIFLQHGVMGVDTPLYYQERSKFDLFICGAKPEYEYVASQFHYKNGEVRYTGLARFDALHSFKTKRQVLIMPTYRKWLQDMSPEEVARSEYVERWSHLLNHPRLAEIAEKYNVQILFYPHQLMQKFIGLFPSDNPNIIIGDSYTFDVQPLLKESALLITDFSSVHFDFAYMEKPVLYYQFDEERMFREHNGRASYFDYQTMGFGEKCQSEEALLEGIADYAVGDFQRKPEYARRVEGFFPLHDTHNCERIYQEIAKSFGVSPSAGQKG